jgi:hypothetical protein
MTRYTLSKALVVSTGILLLIPPIIRLKAISDERRENQKEATVNFSPESPLPLAARGAITATVLPNLPDGFRNEKPRHPLSETSPVRWNSKFKSSENPDLWRKFQSHTADTAVIGPASLIDVWENDRPLPGISLIFAPLGKTDREEKFNPWRIVVYLKIPDEESRTRILQAWADGTLDLKYDLAVFLPLPVLVDENQRVIHAIATAPLNSGLIVNQSWDWALESEKVKMDFADRLRRARDNAEIEAIQAQIKAKRDEGYDL